MNEIASGPVNTSELYPASHGRSRDRQLTIVADGGRVVVVRVLGIVVMRDSMETTGTVSHPRASIVSNSASAYPSTFFEAAKYRAQFQPWFPSASIAVHHATYDMFMFFVSTTRGRIIRAIKRTIDLLALGPGPHQEVDPGAPAEPLAAVRPQHRGQSSVRYCTRDMNGTEKDRPGPVEAGIRCAIGGGDGVLGVGLGHGAVDVVVLGVEELPHPPVGRSCARAPA